MADTAAAPTGSDSAEAEQTCAGSPSMDTSEAVAAAAEWSMRETEAPQQSQVDDSAVPADSNSAPAPVEDAADTQSADQEPDAIVTPTKGEVATIAASSAKAPKTNGGIKRKATSTKTMTLAVVRHRIKTLQDEADQNDAAAAEHDAAAAAMRAAAVSKRAEARKVSQDHARVLREAALATLEASMRKKPSNPWLMFIAEVMPTMEEGEPAHIKTIKVKERWTNLGVEEKQKYKNRFEEERKKYLHWCASEEGRTILRERDQILRECKATSEEALAGLVKAPQGALESPVKQPRVEQAKAKAPLTTEPVLDEKVLQEAEGMSMRAQLCNLAARPDVALLKKSPQELLNALKASNGMVNAAKRSLLGE